MHGRPGRVEARRAVTAVAQADTGFWLSLGTETNNRFPSPGKGRQRRAIERKARRLPLSERYCGLLGSGAFALDEWEHRVPNQAEAFLGFSKNFSGVKEVWNGRLARVSPGADSENLKIRRLPPTAPLPF